MGATGGHRGPQGATGGRRGPQGAAGGHRGAQGATGGHRGPRRWAPFFERSRMAGKDFIYRIRGAGRMFFIISVWQGRILTTVSTALDVFLFRTSAWQGRISTTVSMVLGAFARAFPQGREGFHASVLIDMCIKRGGVIASRALVNDFLYDLKGFRPYPRRCAFFLNSISAWQGRI